MGGMCLSRQRWIMRPGAQVGEYVTLCSRKFHPTGREQSMCLQMLTGEWVDMGIGVGRHSCLVSSISSEAGKIISQR